MTELKTVHLNLPACTADLRKLEIGSVAYLTGRVFTAREGVYKRAIEDGAGMPAGKDALGIVNFHCSPAAHQSGRQLLPRRRRDRRPPRSASPNGSTAGSSSPAATSSSAKAA